MIFTFKPSDDSCKAYEDPEGLIKVCGDFCLDEKFLPLKLTGEFGDSSYGPELILTDAKLSCNSEEDAEQFLSSLRKSLTRDQIRKILKVTGPEIFSAAKDRELEKEAGKALGVENSWEFTLFIELRCLSDELELYQILRRHKGTLGQVMKIMHRYPGNALEVIRKQPYDIPEIAGIPFPVIDRVALANGADPTGQPRVEAILLWVLERIKKDGSICATLDEIADMAGNYVDVPTSLLKFYMIINPQIIEDKEHHVYYERSAFWEEGKTAKGFARLMRCRKELPYHPEYIDRIEKEQGYKFGSQQREVFTLLRSTGFKLLTGDPGTGKTSTLNGLLRYLEMLWKEEYGKEPEFALCAPSGRAAQRMREMTGRPARTIHKLIDYQPYGDTEYYRDERNPLSADIVVVDESSMVGLSIFSKLIGAVKNGAMILMIGDVNQLPSVDAGNVLQDIVKCGCVDTCNLTETFRQKSGSLINENARRIIKGDPHLQEGEDFEIVTCRKNETEAILKEKVLKAVAEFGKDSVQVLSPVKAGSCGVREGNAALQRLLNPGGKGIQCGSRIFKAGDRVIMTANNYDLAYYNGDIGYIIQTGRDSVRIEIGDGQITIPRRNFEDMDLAYVTTVHKAQGSEYDSVIIVLQEEAWSLLSRSLLYTAVTRARRKVILIQEGSGMIKGAVGNSRVRKRNSFLAERIQEEISKPADNYGAGIWNT